MAVLPLRVQHRHRRRNFVFREMVVADYHIYALAGSVFHPFYGLDSTIQCDDETVTVFLCPVDALGGHTVAFVIPVGNIESHLLGKAFQE